MATKLTGIGVEHPSSNTRPGREEKAILADLQALGTNCADLDRLDRILRQFNIFRVLRFENGEIRHSNMLAWLLQPDESHRLGDSFLRSWLLRVVKDSGGKVPTALSPREIQDEKIRAVEVTREWNHIDLLVKVTTDKGADWVIAIENKLEAKQGDGQLTTYRKRVEAAFPRALHVFVFLTDRDESPRDVAFLTAKHQQIHEVLSDCLPKRGTKVDKEPDVLIRHYLKILEERCMENATVVEIARSIYERHRRALDIIIEYRTDPEQRLTDAILKRIKACAARCRLRPMATNSGIARFLPLKWNTKANRAGLEFGNADSAYVLVELGTRWGPHPWLEVVVSQAPHKKWRRELYELSQRNSFTIDRWNKGTKDPWMRIYAVKCPIRVDHAQLRDVDGKAQEIWSWCLDEMRKPDFQKVIRLVAAHLAKLPHLPLVRR